MKNDEYYMELALKEAKQAYELGEIPVGALIINNLTHEIVASAHNLKESSCDVTSHAEILAIKEASKKNNNWRLENHTIYVTLEPCSMCASAILQARFDRVVIGANEPLMGSFGGKFDLTTVFNSNITVKFGVLKDESSLLLQNFFKAKRK